MRSSESLARRPKAQSATELHGETAESGGLNQNDSEASPNGANVERRATGSAPASGSQLSDRLVVLPELSVADLRLEWRRLFRADPPRLSRDIMIRAIAYWLQEIAHGGASKATQRRLVTLAAEFETGGTIAPPPGPKIKPGSRLVREWHGRTHTVCVTQAGFEFQGKSYRSLTRIARDITGAQWSGPRFFGLTKRSAIARAARDNPTSSEETIPEKPNGRTPSKQLPYAYEGPLRRLHA
jgi:Protein of unknown function (DUF2924)